MRKKNRFNPVLIWPGLSYRQFVIGSIALCFGLAACSPRPVDPAACGAQNTAYVDRIERLFVDWYENESSYGAVDRNQSGFDRAVYLSEWSRTQQALEQIEPPDCASEVHETLKLAVAVYAENTFATATDQDATYIEGVSQKATETLLQFERQWEQLAPCAARHPEYFQTLATLDADWELFVGEDRASQASGADDALVEAISEFERQVRSLDPPLCGTRLAMLMEASIEDYRSLTRMKTYACEQPGFGCAAEHLNLQKIWGTVEELTQEFETSRELFQRHWAIMRPENSGDE